MSDPLLIRGENVMSQKRIEMVYCLSELRAILLLIRAMIISLLKQELGNGESHVASNVSHWGIVRCMWRVGLN